MLQIVIDRSVDGKSVDKASDEPADEQQCNRGEESRQPRSAFPLGGRTTGIRIGRLGIVYEGQLHEGPQVDTYSSTPAHARRLGAEVR